MLNQTKYILVIIVVLILILCFIKYFNSMNIVKDSFTATSKSLNAINGSCDPTILLPSTTNFCDCSGSGYENKYAYYDSNDNKKYDVIAKCAIGNNEWRWRAVGTDVRYGNNCNSKNLPDNELNACRSTYSNEFSLWDVNQRKWIS